MKAIFLCAGKGSRLGPLTLRMPKAMIKVDGKPLVEWLVLLCKKHGVTDIGINLGRHGERIKKYLKNGKKWNIKIKYSFEKKLLGTAGALHRFSKFLDSTFIVIYGDVLTDVDLTKMVSFHLRKNALMTLALKKKQNPSRSSGIAFLNSQKRIKKFIEKPKIFKKESKSIFSNCGVYICEPKILKFIKKGFSDFGYSVIPMIAKKSKKIFGYNISKDFFQEIGTPKNLAKARIAFKSNKIKSILK